MNERELQSIRERRAFMTRPMTMVVFIVLIASDVEPDPGATYFKDA